MSKLVSLKDQPATKEDIGNVFYWVDTTKRRVEIREIKVEDFDKENDVVIFDNGKGIFPNVEYVYRNKPILISEEEYQELKDNNEKLKKSLEAIGCRECPQCGLITFIDDECQNTNCNYVDEYANY